ncbi:MULTISPECIES: hypothetical protein [Novosphingobium]|nr:MULTISPECIES: hypothetical protein [Novosphingobium]
MRAVLGQLGSAFGALSLSLALIAGTVHNPASPGQTPAAPAAAMQEMI